MIKKIFALAVLASLTACNSAEQPAAENVDSETVQVEVNDEATTDMEEETEVEMESNAEMESDDSHSPAGETMEEETESTNDSEQMEMQAEPEQRGGEALNGEGISK